ncbi:MULTISPECIES: DUF6241 domain-containing protein [Terrisporobacter]|uniref:DUF6241 domain-containing protein n=1 Tax=Terrisporobacter muris TaxID=2963284 RepID=A0A9X2MAG8_9FIRM|nr:MULTISPECIES: DUF6241 domain-containing protein [Terrisporobacter]MCR1822611.1 DUF6241 domain-containing protein [Terrisporobacter muris]MDU6983427.1 DUF6241 domain-containing protein [Terrisporobacter othiniensis]
MTKKKKDINLDNELNENLEDVTIEEIDKDMEDFYIDDEKIENIKYNFDKERLIKDAIDKAEKDMTKSKIKKKYIKIAASIVVLISIGVYSPALAYRIPPVMKVLEKINDTLKIDEISASLEIDTIIPKAVVENNKIHFVKITRYKVDKTKENKESKDDNKGSDNKENNNEGSNGKNIVYDEYGVVNFIHQMSNQIINPADGKKFGVIKITPQNIEIALNSIKNINNDEARDYLNKALRKWQNGDFNNAVEVHNYVWHMLGGEIGIASSLDEEEINKIKAQYFK